MLTGNWSLPLITEAQAGHWQPAADMAQWWVVYSPNEPEQRLVILGAESAQTALQGVQRRHADPDSWIMRRADEVWADWRWRGLLVPAGSPSPDAWPLTRLPNTPATSQEAHQ